MSRFIRVRQSSDLRNLTKGRFLRQTYVVKFIRFILVLLDLHFSFHCLTMKRIGVFSRSVFNDNVKIMVGGEKAF